MNKTLQTIRYITADILSAFIAWLLFYLYRKTSIDRADFHFKEQIFIDNNLYFGLCLIPLFWLTLYLLTGTYNKIYRKSRLKELGQTFFISIIGVTVLFFSILLDDDVKTYQDYYLTFIVLFALHFFVTFLFRFILTSITAHKIRAKKIGFNTIIIGSDKNAISIYKEIENQEKASGNMFVGFVHVKNSGVYPLSEHLTHLGHYKNILNLINETKAEEVIIAIEHGEHKNIDKILSEINGANVVVKITPDMHDILLGSVKMNSIFDTALIQISSDLMPVWQKILKRIIDLVAAFFVLTILSPIFIFTAIGVRLSSKGPLLYSHYRIGLHGKPFLMHKFRSMYIDSEKNGPQLSSKNDPRITPFGRFMRKVRLDEIPQFYNVLKGEMSLVGYRPERQFFIDQILKKAPHYKLLFKIRPGITSWGQVKFGYAETVDQMIERLKYDILYLENMTLAVDFKILIYTILIVVQGRGK